MSKREVNRANNLTRETPGNIIEFAERAKRSFISLREKADVAEKLGLEETADKLRGKSKSRLNGVYVKSEQQ